jgi:hypothetical protein
MNDLQKFGGESYEALVEEVGAIITENVQASRWALVQGYWEVGQRIRQDFKDNITELLKDLAVRLKVSERTLWYAVQFYDKYPVLNEVPEGKNISWNKVITKYLPDGQKPHAETEFECPQCHYKGVKNEFHRL